MTFNRFLWRMLLLLLLLVFLLAMVTGCSDRAAQQQTFFSSTPTLESSPTFVFTKIATITSTPVTIKTVTPSQSPTPFPTKTITPTPLATFNPTEVSEIVDQLFFGDVSDISSLGPIEPETSTWGQTQRYMERFAVFSDPYSCCIINAEIPVPLKYQGNLGYPETFNVNFYLKRGLIPQATVDIIATLQYNLLLADILKQYGPPTYVYVFVLDTLPVQTYANYDLLLIYEEQGFLVSIGGKTGTGKMVSLCPDIKEIPQEGKLVVTGNLGEDVPLKGLQAHDFLRRFFERPKPGFMPLQDVTKLSIAQFTEFFTTPGNLCLSIDNPTKSSAP